MTHKAYGELSYGLYGVANTVFVKCHLHGLNNRLSALCTAPPPHFHTAIAGELCENLKLGTYGGSLKAFLHSHNRPLSLFVIFVPYSTTEYLRVSNYRCFEQWPIQALLIR